jgi:hypothetical protein
VQESAHSKLSRRSSSPPLITHHHRYPSSLCSHPVGNRSPQCPHVEMLFTVFFLVQPSFTIPLYSFNLRSIFVQSASPRPNHTQPYCSIQLPPTRATHTHTHERTFTHTHTHTHTHERTFTHTHTHTRTYIHTHTHTHERAFTHTRTYIHTPAPWRCTQSLEGVSLWSSLTD